MIGPAITLRRIPVAWQHDLNVHLSGVRHDRVEVVHFEPQQNTISVGLVRRIGDGPMMMLHGEAVKLSDDLTVPEQLLVSRAAVSTLAAKKALIPAAACFHVGDSQKRLGSHRVTA